MKYSLLTYLNHLAFGLDWCWSQLAHKLKHRKAIWCMTCQIQHMPNQVHSPILQLRCVPPVFMRSSCTALYHCTGLQSSPPADMLLLIHCYSPACRRKLRPPLLRRSAPQSNWFSCGRRRPKRATGPRVCEVIWRRPLLTRSSSCCASLTWKPRWRLARCETWNGMS